jgi:hypothetical protein
MEQHLDPDAPTPVSAERAVAVLAELSLDLLRAIQAAVPVALRETPGDVVEPALVDSAITACASEADSGATAVFPARSLADVSPRDEDAAVPGVTHDRGFALAGAGRRGREAAAQRVPCEVALDAGGFGEPLHDIATIAFVRARSPT